MAFLLLSLNLFACRPYGGPAVCEPSLSAGTHHVVDAGNVEDVATLLACCEPGASFTSGEGSTLYRLDVHGTRDEGGRCGFEVTWGADFDERINRLECETDAPVSFLPSVLLENIPGAGDFTGAVCTRSALR